MPLQQWSEAPYPRVRDGSCGHVWSCCCGGGTTGCSMDIAVAADGYTPIAGGEACCSA